MKHPDIERLITEQLSVEQLSAEELQVLVSGLPAPRAVRPVPSNAALTWLAAGIFVFFSVGAGVLVGLEGFEHLSVLQRIFYYSGVLVCGLIFSAGAVQVAMLGSPVILNPRVALGTVSVGIALLVAALFPKHGVEHFFKDGIPCLLLGSGCALVFGAIAGLFLRKGYVTGLPAAGLFIGSFAGFSGVAVLSLHCPIPNATHIIVWHLGVVGVAAAAGLLAGIVIQRVRLH